MTKIDECENNPENSSTKKNRSAYSLQIFNVNKQTNKQTYFKTTNILHIAEKIV